MARVVTDGSGVWLAVSDHDILHSRSHDGGLTWSVNLMAGRGDEFEPQVATDRLTPGDALGVRLRAFRDRNGTAFPFGVRLPTGPGAAALILYLDGLSPSGQIDEIIFEYNDDDLNGDGLCSGFALVTVMQIETDRSMSNAEDRRRLRTFNKLLRDGEMEARARVFPIQAEQMVQYQQKHGRSQFVDRGFMGGWHLWRYTADSLHTWFRDENRGPTVLTVTPAFGCCAVRVEQPLNITVPHLLHWTGSQNNNLPGGASSRQAGQTSIWTTEFFDVRRNVILLFDRHVNYTIQDQFGDPIVESARDGAKVVIREQVPMVGHVANGRQSLQSWLDAMVAKNTSVDWREPGSEGEIRDHTTIQLPVNTFSANPGGGLAFLVGAGGNLITMNPHVRRCLPGKPPVDRCRRRVSTLGWRAMACGSIGSKVWRRRNVDKALPEPWRRRKNSMASGHG